MKKILTLAAVAALLMTVADHASAKIRRVGYFGTPVTNTDYSDLQSAHDAAAAGDTILVYPGNWSATYSKKLVSIGYGYFVDTAALGTQANPGLQNIKGTQTVQISLAAGSSNSVIEGLDGVQVQGDGTGATLAGIIIRRCNISNYIDFEFNNPTTNWQILQCYIAYIYLYYGGGAISNLTINNCYINGMSGNGGTSANQSGQFTNNVFYSPDFNNGSYILKNNILIYSHSGDANCVYQNNLYDSDYGTITGGSNVGVNSTVMNNNVFVGFSIQGNYSNDGAWALQTGSPAKGIGVGGTDAGMYGGTNPYRLSGIPPIPAFYKLTAPSTTTSGNPYTITFSVRGNN